jgi:2-methylcitrate dehydratase PrpD
VVLLAQTEISRQLAAFAAGAEYDDIPPDVIHLAKLLVLDVVGNAIGGWSTSAAKYALRALRTFEDEGQVSLIAVGRRTTIPYAIFGNVVLASALEADDTPLQLGHHAHCAVVPSLAIAEYQGASGRDLLTAVAAAYEIGMRVAVAATHVKLDPAGHPVRSATGAGVNYVVFPAAAGSGRLLRLSIDQMASALGIAGVTASIPLGLRYRRPYSHAKYNPYAFMAQNGAMGALLAAHGFTGDDAIFDATETEAHWWRMSGALDANPERAVEKLGTEWWMRQVSFKLWPSCRYTHGPLNLFKRITTRERIGIGDIEQVDVWSHSAVTRFHMEEATVTSEADAEFSVPHTIAMTAFNIPPGPQWVAPRYWNDPAVEAIKQRVRFHVSAEMDDALLNESLTNGYRSTSPHAVRVRTKDGKVFEERSDHAPGDPQTPETAVDDQELIEKFQNFAELTLPAPAIEECVAKIMKLDELNDVRPLLKLISN